MSFDDGRSDHASPTREHEASRMCKVASHFDQTAVYLDLTQNASSISTANLCTTERPSQFRVVRYGPGDSHVRVEW